MKYFVYLVPSLVLIAMYNEVSASLLKPLEPKELPAIIATIVPKDKHLDPNPDKSEPQSDKPSSEKPKSKDKEPDSSQDSKPNQDCDEDPKNGGSKDSSSKGSKAPKKQPAKHDSDDDTAKLLLILKGIPLLGELVSPKKD